MSVANRWKHLQQKAREKWKHFVLFQLIEIKRFFGEPSGFTRMKGWRWEWWETLRGIIPPHPDMCRAFFTSATGQAMLAPRGLCRLPSQKLLWESEVCGKGWMGQGKGWEGQVLWPPPALGDSLKKTSGRARGHLKISFRTATGHGLSLKLKSEMGSLRIRVGGHP